MVYRGLYHLPSLMTKARQQTQCAYELKGIKTWCGQIPKKDCKDRFIAESWRKLPQVHHQTSWQTAHHLSRMRQGEDHCKGEVSAIRLLPLSGMEQIERLCRGRKSEAQNDRCLKPYQQAMGSPAPCSPASFSRIQTCSILKLNWLLRTFFQ